MDHAPLSSDAPSPLDSSATTPAVAQETPRERGTEVTKHRETPVGVDDDGGSEAVGSNAVSSAPAGGRGGIGSIKEKPSGLLLGSTDGNSSTAHDAASMPLRELASLSDGAAQHRGDAKSVATSTITVTDADAGSPSSAGAGIDVHRKRKLLDKVNIAPSLLLSSPSHHHSSSSCTTAQSM